MLLFLIYPLPIGEIKIFKIAKRQYAWANWTQTVRYFWQLLRKYLMLGVWTMGLSLLHRLECHLRLEKSESSWISLVISNRDDYYDDVAYAQRLAAGSRWCHLVPGWRTSPTTELFCAATTPHVTVTSSAGRWRAAARGGRAAVTSEMISANQRRRPSHP